MANSFKGGFLRDDSGALVLAGGSSLPTGGTTGQVLAKTSNADGAVAWAAGPAATTTGVPTVFNVKDTAYGAVGNGTADDTTKIQAALDAANTAGKGRVFVPDGTYKITAVLTIGSNTTLELSAGATILRGSNAANSMLTNKADGVTGGYGANQNIQVRGGCWDANVASFTTACNGLSFGHCTNVRVIDVEVKNMASFHHIEFNACKNVIARGCYLHDGVPLTSKECLQIDLMKSSGEFGLFGPYDNTPCDNVLVEGCTFANYSRGSGSHTGVSGFPHTNVRYIGNHVDTMTEEAFYLADHSALVVKGNTIKACKTGIVVTSQVGQALSDFVVADNNMRGFVGSGNGIIFQGVDANRWLSKIVCTGNNINGVVNANALAVANTTDAVVTGNLVLNPGTQVGLLIFRCLRTLVSGNTSRGSTNTIGDIQVGSTGSGTAADTSDTHVVGNTADKMTVGTFATNTSVMNNALGAYVTGGTNTITKANIVAAAYVA